MLSEHSVGCLPPHGPGVSMNPVEWKLEGHAPA